MTHFPLFPKSSDVGVEGPGRDAAEGGCLLHGEVVCGGGNVFGRP